MRSKGVWRRLGFLHQKAWKVSLVHQIKLNASWVNLIITSSIRRASCSSVLGLRPTTGWDNLSDQKRRDTFGMLMSAKRWKSNVSKGGAVGSMLSAHLSH
jgi:hypothetical protein